jgi:hypothetical protein
LIVPACGILPLEATSGLESQIFGRFGHCLSRSGAQVAVMKKLVTEEFVSQVAVADPTPPEHIIAGLIAENDWLRIEVAVLEGKNCVLRVEIEALKARLRAGPKAG